MANIKSAKKKAKQAEKHRIENAKKRSKLSTMIKKIRNLISANKTEEAQKLIPAVYSVIDKSSKVNIIHKNKAARLKSAVSTIIAKKK